MMRLLAEAKAKWAASLIGTPLQKRERDALLKFRGHKVGEFIPWRNFSFGSVTGERLEARGFIELRHDENNSNIFTGSVLTAAGHAAAEALAAG